MANCSWWCVTVLLLNFVLVVTDGLNLTNSAPRACVIGAGYSGLGVSRYLKQNGINFTVFEATRYVGGTWRFDPHIGTDEDGLPLFSSMYKYLRTNTPIQTMEYEGFPFPAGTPSYPAATCFHKYLKLFAKTFGIVENIQFRSLITSVKWSGGHWNVSYTKSDSHSNHTEECDYVIVANGEYLKPLLPKFEGLENFRGKVMHSHDYKEPEPFRNRRVLVVGAGPSGLDMILHLTNVTARLVHSHHLVYNQPDFGPKYLKKPDIKEFTSNGVMFQDNTFEEVDDVLLCTGYDYAHPFLDKSTGITKSGKFLLPLYQQMVNIRHPTMAFVGAAKKVINKVMDAQGEYIAALVAKKFELPSQEVMLKSWLDHVNRLQAKKMKLIHVNVIGEDMDQYFEDLSKEAGIPRRKPVYTSIRDFNAKNRLEDLLNYRDYDYNITDANNFDRWYNKKEVLPCPVEDV